MKIAKEIAFNILVLLFLGVLMGGYRNLKEHRCPNPENSYGQASNAARAARPASDALAHP